MSDDANDELIDRVAAALRGSGAVRPDFDARVMAAIKQPRLSLGPAALRWLTRARPVAVSPLGVLGAAAAVAALIVGTAVAPRLRDVERTARIEVVRFVLAAPGANNVALIGDFNNWDPAATPLRRAGRAGVWVVDVALAPGRHEYGFLIDGREWRPDPAAPRGAENEYGPANSVVTVGTRSS
ncbi:MAG: isoamylase early set domain-containing protein [Gemmatimonadales bacterium]